MPIAPHEHHLFRRHRKTTVDNLPLRHIAQGHLRQTLHAAACTGEQSQDEFEQGTFAPPGWAHERGKLPWVQTEVEVGENRLAGITSAYALQRKQGVRHGITSQGVSGGRR